MKYTNILIAVVPVFALLLGAPVVLADSVTIKCPEGKKMVVHETKDQDGKTKTVHVECK